MPKEQMELKLAPEEKRMLKKLTRSLDTLARSMQLYMPQKPKNSEIRLTEPAQELTEDEIRLLNDPRTWEAVEKAAQSTERRPRPRLRDDLSV